jgi:hypothetical protein
LTLIAALPCTSPIVAVMVALPALIARITPVALTVATEGSEVDHVAWDAGYS